MLAFKFKPERLEFPCFFQPKLNGVRGLFLPKAQTFQSRDEHLWEPLVVKHQLTGLKRCNVLLDGEFYCHGLSLQQINSRIAVNRITPHDKAAEIVYNVFDIPSMSPMHHRVQMLEALEKHFKDHPNINVVPTKLVYSQREADYWYGQWKDQGYEGGMYRLYHAPYGFEHNCGNKENRWWHLQKRKDFLDLQAVIEDIYEGEDGFAGMLGGFVCRLDNDVRCNVGGGLTIDQRQLYWANPQKVIGAKVDINYEMFSDGGQPLKATIECVHELM